MHLGTQVQPLEAVGTPLPGVPRDHAAALLLGPGPPELVLLSAGLRCSPQCLGGPSPNPPQLFPAQFSPLLPAAASPTTLPAPPSHPELMQSHRRLQLLKRVSQCGPGL